MSEFELWKKILLNCMEEKRKDDPSIPISDVYIDAYKLFLEEKWICHLEPNKFNFTEEEYEKIGFDDGPDLTRLPRTRYSHISSKEKKSTKARPNRYRNFQKEQFKLGIKDFKEHSRIWNQLSEEEKKKYEVEQPEDDN